MFRFLGVYGIILITFCLCPMAYADTVILDSGERIIGEVIDRTDLRVTIDVQGSPQTFFLGEVSSINGAPIEILKSKEAAPSPAINNAPVPNLNIQKESLSSFMSQRNSNMTQPRPANSQNIAKLQELVVAEHETMDKIAKTSKNVVPTRDGGIVIVSPSKIVKYDKDLNVVKEVDLALDDILPLAAAPAPAPVTPAAASVASSSPAAPVAAAASADQSTASSSPETLKDFLNNTIGAFFSSGKK